MQRRKGFTLTELLVVISIIVVVIAVLVPSIKAMTGDRSVPLAQNRLGSLLATARESAINSNSITGIAIFPDATGTGDTMVAFVQVNPYTQVAGQTVGQYLDIIPNSEETLLQRGVTAQIIMQVNPLTGPPAGQRYTPIGVILFDSQGHMLTNQVLQTLGIQPVTGLPTQLGQAFQIQTAPTPTPTNFVNTPVGVGLALVDTETYKNQIKAQGWSDAGQPATYGGSGIGGTGIVSTLALSSPPGTPANPIVWGGSLGSNQAPFAGMSNDAGNTTAEPVKDSWLDGNATILMINPATGSLVAAK